MGLRHLILILRLFNTLNLHLPQTKPPNSDCLSRFKDKSLKLKCLNWELRGVARGLSREQASLFVFLRQRMSLFFRFRDQSAGRMNL